MSQQEKFPVYDIILGMNDCGIANTQYQIQSFHHPKSHGAVEMNWDC